MAVTAAWQENFPIMMRSEEIDVVEPDEVFVEVCKKFFPDNACGLDDPRVKVYNADGLRFLRTKNDMYDLIINDADRSARTYGGTFYQGILRKLFPRAQRGWDHGIPARKSVL